MKTKNNKTSSRSTFKFSGLFFCIFLLAAACSEADEDLIPTPEENVELGEFLGTYEIRSHDCFITNKTAFDISKDISNGERVLIYNLVSGSDAAIYAEKGYNGLLSIPSQKISSGNKFYQLKGSLEKSSFGVTAYFNISKGDSVSSCSLDGYIK